MGTPPWDRRASSTLRFRFSISPMRSRSLLSDWLRALRPLRMPHLCAQVEDGQRDRWQEDGGASLLEVERDGAVQFPATAAARVRYFQELRGLVARGLYGWQRCRHVGQGHLLRAQGGGCCGWQEEVSQQDCADASRLRR